MKISLLVNGERKKWDVEAGDTLLRLLRREGYFSVKHGCEDGTCGVCTVLVNGEPRCSCITLAAQVDGAAITTVEGLGGSQMRGWKGSAALHPLQQAFVETGAIQSGYDVPALLLAAKALLDRNPAPTEAQVREALSGILARESGYVKPVQAVLRAAAVLRGEEVPPLEGGLPSDLLPQPDVADGAAPVQPRTVIFPRLVVTPETEGLQVVGKPEQKVDALKLVQGKPAFVSDVEMPGMLYARILRSPVAHARVKSIDASRARALPGVHAVLTHKDVPRVVFSSAGQSHPIPGPLDVVSLDDKVRYVGDRVAVVAAESPEVAAEAIGLIDVVYEPLPAVLDPRQAMEPGAPVIHDEADYVPFGECDPARNLAAKIRIELGDVDAAMAQADAVFEGEYEVQRVHSTPIEPWVCLTYWDADDRLVIRTSTQVPFHVRRILAPVLGLPEKRIRVVKPRVGGAFGNKQEVYEDLCAHLTIVTGRPVLLEYTREEQFAASTVRHPMIIKMRTGVMDDGTILANEMIVLSDTGAYGSHALTVTGNTGHKVLSIYDVPNIRFWADVVYTNYGPSGAYRGYGVPQGCVALEPHIERICREMGWDSLEFRLKNAVKAGAEHPMSKVWSEGREAHGEVIHTCALPEAAARGAAAFGWRRVAPTAPHLRRGHGVAFVMQGTAIPYLDMGAASLKINDDGSFNLLVGATDLGTGSDTVLAQMAAEVLGCPVEDFIVYSSDTDFTPFDKGAYASSTTYVSGGAVVRAAQEVALQIRRVAGRMLAVDPDEIALRDRAAWAPDGRSVTLREVALESLHHSDQSQIMGVASFWSEYSPPPFAAQFAEVLVDVETGQVTVERLLMALDCGKIVNPLTAGGQVEGGMHQALGYAVSEELVYDRQGRPVNPRFDAYRLFRADEMPAMEVIFVETWEPTHPFGVKSVAEIPVDGVAPAVINAVYDAVGVLVPTTPLTPEKVWRALRTQGVDQ
ncbi:MAG: molybdopterin-dependent oxidoreductase [Anaerolineae bacterium]|nr:molybdopterin-dependent oxidoreductase [Anaerolineae bacterium]